MLITEVNEPLKGVQQFLKMVLVTTQASKVCFFCWFYKKNFKNYNESKNFFLQHPVVPIVSQTQVTENLPKLKSDWVITFQSYSHLHFWGVSIHYHVTSSLTFSCFSTEYSYSANIYLMLSVRVK